MSFVSDNEGEPLAELTAFCNLGSETRKHKGKGFRNVNMQSEAGAVW